MNLSKVARDNYIALLLVAIVFFQNPPWFIWSVSYNLMAATSVVLFLSCVAKANGNFSCLSRSFPILLGLVSFFIVYSSIDAVRFSSVVTVLVFASLFFVNEADRVKALGVLTKVLSAIVSISLLAWLVNLYLNILPFEYVQYGEGKGDSENTILRNYYFFLQLESDWNVRFYSVFDEPGVLGTLIGFVLFANKYNFKDKKNLIIFLGGLCTFSLGFYVMSVVGYFVVFRKKAIKALVLFCVFCLALSVVAWESEVFNNLIVNRLIGYDEAGVESRTSDELNSAFQQYIGSAEIFLGKGTAFFLDNPSLKAGQSYKIFFIEYGLVGAVLVILMYLSLARRLETGLLCIVIFIVSFLQRPFMFTPGQVVIYSIVLASFKDSLLSGLRREMAGKRL